MLESAAVRAGDIMTRDVATVRPETTLLDTVRLMAARHISGVPVVDASGALVGMVSEGDLVRWHEGYSEKQARWLDMLADGFNLAAEFLEGIRAQNHTAGAIMAKDVVTVSEDTLAREIASLMHTRSIKRVPVVRDGKLVGIVARSDLVRALAEKLGEAHAASGAPAASVDEALRRAREEVGSPGGTAKR